MSEKHGLKLFVCMAKIVIMESDKDTVFLYTHMLRKHHELTFVHTGRELLMNIRGTSVAIVNSKLPDITLDDLCDLVYRAAKPQKICILIIAASQDEAKLQQHCPGDQWIKRPFPQPALLNLIAACLQKVSATPKN
jgi:DNA-binding response OmpR family regulator